MRRRDVVFISVAGAGFLAALYWALSTQLRWVQENKPIQVKQPAGEQVEPAPTGATGVTGTVTDDTREAMARSYGQKKPSSKKEQQGAGMKK